MRPSLDDYAAANATWTGRHKSVFWKVSHHAISGFRPEGIWCFYVNFDERMFQNPEDWKLFDLPVQVKDGFSGRLWEHFPYDDIPELPWHSGATYGKRHSEFNPDTGARYTVIEVGCDYGHVWDEENDFWQGRKEVTADAIALIEEFIRRFPQKEICAYCGKMGMPDDFYTARNGSRVLRSQLSELPEGRTMWRPAEENADASQEVA